MRVKGLLGAVVQAEGVAGEHHACSTSDPSAGLDVVFGSLRQAESLPALKPQAEQQQSSVACAAVEVLQKGAEARPRGIE